MDTLKYKKYVVNNLVWENEQGACLPIIYEESQEWFTSQFSYSVCIVLIKSTPSNLVV